ncbi:DNA-binding protein HU [candidate division WWE3 bacterium CG09_land_8_20_14_0_10_39_24]|uniref:DNA-binding protein HU n=1 Tax=candidate division WWE3 bacterium CG09_land_8_20_14_0_10_39_24 TaxID=1975088 RepID=A0A2H0WJJ1_UNCKA|nr:MAG: DNA-binding protein HU [bacterium CG09_39_24]PIS12853.1 MAG: DNA-binding protein HU [candidate division WWE3 bacterium CG09_land_8_20_14_0_10_39_24]
MTKTQLVDMVAEMSGTTKAAAGRAADALVEAVSKALAKGEKVVLTGFGTFEVRRRAARMGRNPQTGAPLHISATKTPAFKAGKALKDAVK